MNSDCLFCKIIQKEIPSRIRFEDEHAIVFDDIRPKAPIHVLIVPKKHLASMTDLGNEDAVWVGELFQHIPAIASHLGLEEGGYKTIINTGKNSGQVIDHLHIHVLGGSKISGIV